MKNDAAIFSRSRTIVFDRPVARSEIERLLKKCLGNIGRQLSFNKVILGHIKMIAYLSGKEDFIFLSLTSTDRIDSKFSPSFQNSLNEEEIKKADLDINVVLFGHSLRKVKLTVNSSLQKLKTCLEEDGTPGNCD